MIGKLKGIIDSYADDHVIIDVQGVGYVVQCSSRTLQRLPRAGEAATLAIETQVREDAIRLFGFLTEAERERLFDRVASWCVAWSVGMASHEECDALGMSAAQKLAARRALDKAHVKLLNPLAPRTSGTRGRRRTPPSALPDRQRTRCW